MGHLQRLFERISLFKKSPRITVMCASRTDKGGREENQDCSGYRYDENPPQYNEWCEQKKAQKYCFVVADGLGGHRGGQKASKTVVNSILKYFPVVNVRQKLPEAIRDAHERIKQEAKSVPELTDMKTTCVVLIISGCKAYWSNVGDSRIYIFRKGNQEQKLIVRSKDHSVVQVLLDIGEIEEKEVRGHPDRNRVLKTLGMEEDLDPKVFPDSSEAFILEPGDYLLLCTDGFWEYFSDEELYHFFFDISSHHRFKEQVEVLFTEAKKRAKGGGTKEKYDNITFQLIRIK